MHTEKATTTCSRRGVALLMSLLFLAVFSSLGLAILTMSSRNMQVANNHSQAGRALESAFSGMEVMNYRISKISIDRTTADDERFDAVVANLVADDIALGSANPVTLDSSDPKSFYAQLESLDNDTFQVRVTGQAGGLQRTVAVNYEFRLREDTVFDYGVASKGPLQLFGNIELNGTNIAVEADVYIESVNNNNVLSIIGNSQIAGRVKVTNPDGIVFLQGGQAGIGGETGQDAIDNQVDLGVPSPDFPVPNTAYFEKYVTGDIIDSDTDVNDGGTYENVRIAAGTNPHFSNVTINGIMFIEAPNEVTFTGNCNINGLIVAAGSMDDNSGTNWIKFEGTVESSSVTELPDDSRFDGLRDETGTFLMAPGFSVIFRGNFDTLNGAIAANGIEFDGDAGGTIAGSVINYSDTPMVLRGNNDLFFNRSGVTEVPAGFELELVLHHDPASYEEPVL